MKPAFSLFLALLAGHAGAFPSEGVRPQRFGPFLQHSLAVEGNPAGYERIFPFGGYNFQAGWMEPIAIFPGKLFRGSYIETQGNITITPGQSDFGVAFNLRPIRFLEFGLSYNRLFFPYTLAGFNTPEGAAPGSSPSPEAWRPPQIFDQDRLEAAGADIFTYQANVTAGIGRLQFHGGGSYGMWDVASRSHDFVLDYRTGMLIKRRDRIGSLYAQAMYTPSPNAELSGFSVTGLGVRNHYWWTVQTALSQNLLSAGFTGLRRGRNGERLYLGLDGWIGYWAEHVQLEGRDIQERLHVSLQWTWNIQILDMSSE